MKNSRILMIGGHQHKRPSEVSAMQTTLDSLSVALWDQTTPKAIPGTLAGILQRNTLEMGLITFVLN